ncbi:hypothetical protein RHSIM_Rhsim04G0166100 [Rhododendron simsii]|uniref:ELM2 domain-containing protein n=1 Tax=Rhododendron simsii TaxID=118357 RepID=A0A834LQL6_RHOSS|nr:hypothetical protein RHSIM_Rhsim04G0166100 [Rhododendron simsii]
MLPGEGPCVKIKMDCDKQEKIDKAYLLEGGGMRRLSVFGKYSDLDMLLWIKGLALDPCSSGASPRSVRSLWNQNIKVRKVMALSVTECPRRKRKLQQFIKDNFAAARRLNLEISDQHSVGNANKRKCLLGSVDTSESFHLSKSQSSQSLVTSEDTFSGKQVPTEFSQLDDRIDRVPSKSNVCPALESEESDNGSILHDLPSFDWDDDSINSSNYSSCEVGKGLYLQERRRSIRLRNFIGDHLQRMAIPVGPGFQADVPEWNGPPNKESFNFQVSDSKTSRWLGTRIWPLKGLTKKINDIAVGKGRPNSCPCVSPGSIDCTKCHIIEERLRLQSDLGAAFLSWKFDEMGEDVSKSWTLKEQERFELLAKTYPLSQGKDFLKHALKCFPLKGKEIILSFYFNVFIPRHMSLQTRSP